MIRTIILSNIDTEYKISNREINYIYDSEDEEYNN
jgi:hypothetical protein